MSKIYTIAQLWIDTLENHHAYGYNVIGYTMDLELVNQLQNTFVKKSMFPYPLNYIQNGTDQVPQFKVTEVPLLDINDINFNQL